MFEPAKEAAMATDGTSNTVLFSERHLRPDGDYLLTSVQHPAAEYEGSFLGGVFVASGDVNGTGEDSLALWQINVEPSQGSPDIQKGEWITDATYEGGTTVAMEFFTISHEGFLPDYY
jgi:hypothetical protein